MIPFDTLCAGWRIERAGRMARFVTRPRLGEEGLTLGPMTIIAKRVAFRLFCAEKLLDAGVTPYELMDGLRLAKYAPDQPRVPAGNPDGGQWTSGGGAASGGLLQYVQELVTPGELPPELFARPPVNPNWVQRRSTSFRTTRLNRPLKDGNGKAGREASQATRPETGIILRRVNGSATTQIILHPSRRIGTMGLLMARVIAGCPTEHWNQKRGS